MDLKKSIISILLLLIILLTSYTSPKAEIKVYDNNNQFLGVLVESNIFFIPSLNVIISLMPSANGELLDGLPHPMGSVYYDSNDCSGDPYSGDCENHIWEISGTYYKPSFNDRITPASYSKLTSGNCTQHSDGATLFKHESVTLPFTLPATMPLRYEHSLGDTVSNPNSFTAGTPAVASEVNENFDALFDKINEMNSID